MFVIAGVKPKLRKDIWAGKSICPKCGQTCDFHLYKLAFIVRIFFIPIMSIAQKKYIVCDSCAWDKELSGKEYREIKKKQMELLKQGMFPKEIIQRDFSPSEIRLGWRCVKLILSGIAIFTPFGIFAIIAFIVSLKNFIPALKKRRAYKVLRAE